MSRTKYPDRKPVWYLWTLAVPFVGFAVVQALYVLSMLYMAGVTDVTLNENEWTQLVTMGVFAILSAIPGGCLVCAALERR